MYYLREWCLDMHQTISDQWTNWCNFPENKLEQKFKCKAWLTSHQALWPYIFPSQKQNCFKKIQYQVDKLQKYMCVKCMQYMQCNRKYMLQEQFTNSVIETVSSILHVNQHTCTCTWTLFPSFNFFKTLAARSASNES